MAESGKAYGWLSRGESRGPQDRESLATTAEAPNAFGDYTFDTTFNSSFDDSYNMEGVGSSVFIDDYHDEVITDGLESMSRVPRVETVHHHNTFFQLGCGILLERQIAACSFDDNSLPSLQEQWLERQDAACWSPIFEEECQYDCFSAIGDEE